jgi:hypothetical protein
MVKYHSLRIVVFIKITFFILIKLFDTISKIIKYGEKMRVKDIVAKFDGQTLLAQRLGIRQSAIAYWVKKGAIPSKWHSKLLSIAQEKGIDILAADLLAVDLDGQLKPERNSVAAKEALRINMSPLSQAERPESSIGEGLEQFLFYASENRSIKIQVLLGEETVWATQQGISEIFDTSRENITIHLKNIFEINELDEKAVCKEFLLAASDGKRYNTKVYNLDAIISVGYRVSSYKATQFRRWATTILKEYLIKGFTLDDERLKQGNQLFGKDYFDELLERIREIRASERRFYQKITDIYSQCSIDYDKDSPITQQFYAHVQDKLHYAIHGHTSAELIKLRADASKPNMGLFSYKNVKSGGKITKMDVTVGKNYLNEEEINDLNRLVSMYLDFAENFARRKVPMTMKDWAAKLDGFLEFNAYKILSNYGETKRTSAEKFALSEFEKFRVSQDQNFESDFDKLVDEAKVKGR